MRDREEARQQVISYKNYFFIHKYIHIIHKYICIIHFQARERQRKNHERFMQDRASREMPAHAEPIDSDSR